MTATAVPAAGEFREFYGLTTVVFPPHRPCRRVDEPDVVFTHRDAKIRRAGRRDRPRAGDADGPCSSARRASRSRSRCSAPCAVGASSAACSTRATTPARPPSSRAPACPAPSRSPPTWPAAAPTSSSAAATRRSATGWPRSAASTSSARTATKAGASTISCADGPGRQGDPGSSRFFISLEDDLISRYGVMSLIPRTRRPARQDGPVADPIVAREIARAQRIIEGQNFEIRRTLWRYSAMVEEQRAQMYARREELLHDVSEPTACAEDAPEHHAALSQAAGANEVRAGGEPADAARARPSLERPPAAHRGHPRGHPPAAVRRARSADRVPAADHRRLCRR